MRGQNSETKASDNTGKEDGDKKRSTSTEEEDGTKQNREEKQSRVEKHNGDVSKPNEAERAHRKKKIRKCKDTGPEIASTARKGKDGDGRDKEDAGVSTPHETGHDHEKEKSRRSTDHKGLGKKQKRRRTDKKHAAPTDTEIGAAMENRLRQLQAPHLDEWLASPRGRIAKELERARRNNTELQLSREAGKTHETIPRPQPSTGFMPGQSNENEQDGADSTPGAAAGDALTHAATMKGEARKPTRAVPEAAQAHVTAQAEGQVAGPPMPVVDIARSAAATRQWPHIMARRTLAMTTARAPLEQFMDEASRTNEQVFQAEILGINVVNGLVQVSPTRFCFCVLVLSGPIRG